MKFNLTSYLKLLKSFYRAARLPKDSLTLNKGPKDGLSQERFQVEHSAKFAWNWKKKDTLIYGDSGTVPSELILAMDLVIC